ncbi:MAG TPA: thiamine pyrophosphate-requiring protein [Burkholderiales bacterium]|nr:thiamine pyrophosphate-requiring protein [Burkholderiales bacterium]
MEIEASDAGEAVVAAMTAGGVELLFFTSGSELAFYQEAIAKARAQGRKAPRLVLLTHEVPALNAALGYAASTGKPAATAAHVDVGTQHYGSAIHSAMRSGLPVLITAGAPPVGMPGTRRGARDAGHFWVQDLYDQNGIVRQYMKWEHRLEMQDNPGLAVSRALQVACTAPCGPVYLSLPREVALAPLGRSEFPTAQELGIARPAAPDPDAIEEVAKRLTFASNPALVVSGSGRDPASVPLLVELAEHLGMAVVDSSSRSYHCFPMDHPLYQATIDLSVMDVVVALDAEVPWMPGPKAPSPKAYVAVIDEDPAKLKIPTYEFRASVRVTANATAALHALLREVKRIGKKSPERGERWAAVSKARRDKARADAQAVANKSPIDPSYLAHCVGELLDANCVLVDDTLSHNPMYHYLHRLGGAARYFRNPGSAGGWGPGAALGVKMGLAQRDVVLVTGDGFWMYGSPTAALWTARQHGAPFLSVIFQNRSYSTGTRATASLYPDGYAVKGGLDGGYFDPPMDFALEAQSAGAYGENVREAAQLLPALRRGLEKTRAGIPAVIAAWLPRILQKD